MAILQLEFMNSNDEVMETFRFASTDGFPAIPSVGERVAMGGGEWIVEDRLFVYFDEGEGDKKRTICKVTFTCSMPIP